QERAEVLEVVGDDEALEPQTLADHEAEIARPGLRALVVVARDRAARDDAAEWPERAQRGFELRAADVVEVHVDAVSERLFCRCLAVVERLDAERAQPIDLLVGACASDRA